MIRIGSVGASLEIDILADEAISVPVVFSGWDGVIGDGFEGAVVCGTVLRLGLLKLCLCADATPLVNVGVIISYKYVSMSDASMGWTSLLTSR